MTRFAATAPFGLSVLLATLVAPATACGNGGSMFNECVTTAQCEGTDECFLLTSGAGICLSTCDGTTPTCAGGEACASVGSGGFACLPGGELGQGETCTRSIDCGLGLLCIDTGPDSIDVCRITCDPEADTCTGGSVCVSLDGGNDRGYCGAAL